MDIKNNMRASILSRRDGISPAEREKRSTLICHEIEGKLATAFEASGRPGNTGPFFAVFSAIRSEVDLQRLVDAGRSRGWRACFPCMVRNNPADKSEPSHMAFYHVSPEEHENALEALIAHPLRYRSRETLARSGYVEIAPCDLDAVIVPLVAFDACGNRLGYGGGNYDQLLPKLRRDAVVIGAAFNEQRVDAVPCEEHDIPLPCIVSA